MVATEMAQFHSPRVVVTSLEHLFHKSGFREITFIAIKGGKNHGKISVTLGSRPNENSY
jgi:hypothetical protein